MARKKSEVPEMEKMLQYGRKKFVRYDVGAKIYSTVLHTFQDLAKEAGNCAFRDYKLKKIAGPITQAENIRRELRKQL